MNWISINDRLPEPDRHVLAWDGELKEWCVATFNKGGLPFDIWGEGWDYKNKITHWMPLPEAP